MNSLDPHTVNPWAIDSLKIRIPLSRVKVLDSSIGDTAEREAVDDEINVLTSYGPFKTIAVEEQQ